MMVSYTFMAHLFGLTFALKLMEKGERLAQVNYREIAGYIPQAAVIEKEEEAHELKLISLLDEEKLKYIGSMVLGSERRFGRADRRTCRMTFALKIRSSLPSPDSLPVSPHPYPWQIRISLHDRGRA
jgi:hypothetical protein